MSPGVTANICEPVKPQASAIFTSDFVKGQIGIQV